MRTRYTAFLAGLTLAAVAACNTGDDDVVGTEEHSSISSVIGCSSSQNPGNMGEGEFFGRSYTNGIRLCGSGVASLQPRDNATTAKFNGTAFDPILEYDANHIFKWDFEWWDPVASDGPCHGFLNNTQPLEVHPADDDFGDGVTREGHCILPGRYTFSAPGLSMDVDYLSQTTPASGFVDNLTTNPVTEELVEDVAETHCQACQREFIVSIDNGNYSGNEVLTVDAAIGSEDPQHADFDGQIPAQGDMNTWYRFSTVGTTSNWSMQGKWMARLYWDYTNNPSDRTGFYDVASGFPLLRLHKFPNPTTATRTYTVALGVIRPGDSPAEDEEIVTRQIVIRRINPNLKGVSITGAPSSVLAGTSFNATVTGKNWGPGPAEAGWVGRMYLSTDATFNRTQDVLLTGATATFPALGVNSQASRSGSFQVAAGQAGGNYTLFVEVDGNFNVIEEPPGGENDNGLIGIPMTITAALPNIRPYDVASSINYIAIGTSANVTLTTENAGTAAASGGWWNRLYLSTDNTCCTSDVLLDSTNQTTTIAAGNVGYTSKSVTIPAGTTPGTYYLGAFVDSRATLTESNENDNKGVGLTTIHALQCAWPEEITVLVGQTVTITPTGSCTGRWGVITPANGTLGFGTAAPCSSTSALVKPVGLKFYRCSAGTNTLTVYTDFTLSVVEQVITVSDAF